MEGGRNGGKEGGRKRDRGKVTRGGSTVAVTLSVAAADKSLTKHLELYYPLVNHIMLSTCTSFTVM